MHLQQETIEMFYPERAPLIILGYALKFIREILNISKLPGSAPQKIYLRCLKARMQASCSFSSVIYKIFILRHHPNDFTTKFNEP